MIKLKKRPLPPKPITCENDYRSDPNFTALCDDCFNKCYICENDRATTVNVEHRVAHEGKPLLKYDWHNLFLSCGHCNNIKLAAYNGIIDPSKCDPEDHIALSLTTENYIEKVLVTPLANDESTKQTAKLLDIVYNGEKTAQKKLESENLRNIVSENVAKFIRYITAYQEEPDESLQTVYHDEIEREISRSSAFAAFKRQIVREDRVLSSSFAAALV